MPDANPSEHPVAIVTGGGTGIGAAVAAELAAAGYEVAVFGRRLGPLSSVAEADPERRTHAFAVDVADRAVVDESVGKVLERFGRVDVLVNAAGVNIVDRTMAATTPEDWEKVLTINASGAFHTMQAVLPSMKAAGAGTIVNISSVAGRRAAPLGGVAYNASKFAMTALGASVGEEVKDDGVRVTSIFPGEVETPILDARPVPVSAEHRARILQPEDVAAAVMLAVRLPPRARIPELVIVPTTQTFL